MLPRGLVLCRRSVAFSSNNGAFCQSSTHFLPAVALWIHSFFLTLRSLYLSAVLLSEGDLRNSFGIAQTASSVRANCLWVQKYAQTQENQEHVFNSLADSVTKL